MKMRFHIKDDDTIGQCQADQKACPKKSLHFTTEQEAQKYIDSKLSEKFGQFASKTNHSGQDKQQIKISKRMSYALRHQPEKFNLTLAQDGSVDLATFAKAMDMTISQVEQVVTNDSKGRFIITKDKRILAHYGHSTKQVSVPANSTLINELDKDSDLVTDTLFHGTKQSVLKEIMSGGLKPMSRNFVHLTKDLDYALMVADRRKNSDSIMLQINVAQMMKDGIKIWFSEGVYLTESVPPKYISLH